MEPKAPKPLRKLNIFANCFIALFLIAWVYLDFIVKLESIYWKIAELFAILSIFMLTIILKRVRDKHSWSSIILSIITAIFCIGFWSWHEIMQYKNKRCLDKFGTEFNLRRQKLGIPLLPADWHIDFQDSRSTDWRKKDSMGHYYKTTLVDSLCAPEYEEDRYNLKPVRGVLRNMLILTWFDNKKHADTIRYEYTGGNSTRTITRQQADSIFAAEKIQKDY